MNLRRFQDVWIDQRAATCRITEEHGVKSAFDYLGGEKLMTYAQTAVTRPEFSRELPFRPAVRAAPNAVSSKIGNSRRSALGEPRGRLSETPRVDPGVESKHKTGIRGAQCLNRRCWVLANGPSAAAAERSRSRADGMSAGFLIVKFSSIMRVGIREIFDTGLLKRSELGTKT